MKYNSFMEKETEKEEKESTEKETPKESNENTGQEFVSFDDFMKLDLRTAKILEAEDIKGKDKLFRLTMDLGTEKRTLLAGLKEFYSKEEMKGKTIIIVANLKPKKMAGILSQGMLLAAEHEEKVSLLTLDKELPAGSKIH